MLAYNDLIAKYILAAALMPEGVAQVEHEIPVLAPQATDLYFEPAPGPRPDDDQTPLLRWLRFMTPVPCLVELYSHSLTLMEFLRGPQSSQGNCVLEVNLSRSGCWPPFAASRQ